MQTLKKSRNNSRAIEGFSGMLEIDLNTARNAQVSDARRSKMEQIKAELKEYRQKINQLK